MRTSKVACVMQAGHEYARVISTVTEIGVRLAVYDGVDTGPIVQIPPLSVTRDGSENV